MTVERDALSEIFERTQGYPYFLQEWGSHLWNLASVSRITLEMVKSAKPSITASLNENFFRVRFDRLTPKEKDYLRVMAELRDSRLRSTDIAGQMGSTSRALAPVRNSLVGKGMIYSPKHGETAFTVPLFDEFMIATMSYPLNAKSRPERTNPIKDLLK